MRIEIKITGNGLGPVEDMVSRILECANSAGLKDARADYSYGRVESCPPMFYTGDSEENLVSDNDAVEMSVNFASIVSARLADEHNLDVSDFEDVEPSGKRGFTVEDVLSLMRNTGAV